MPWPRVRSTPLRSFIGAAAMAIACLILTLSAVHLRSQAWVSQRTQSHGVHESVSVTAVEHIAHTHKHSTSYDTQVTAELPRLVHGESTTIVHIDGYHEYPDGSHLDALIDPDDGGYAELPGRPMTTASDWVVCLVAALVSGFGILGAVVWGVRRWRRDGWYGRDQVLTGSPGWIGGTFADPFRNRRAQPGWQQQWTQPPPQPYQPQPPYQPQQQPYQPCQPQPPYQPPPQYGPPAQYPPQYGPPAQYPPPAPPAG